MPLRFRAGQVEVVDELPGDGHPEPDGDDERGDPDTENSAAAVVGPGDKLAHTRNPKATMKGSRRDTPQPVVGWRQSLALSQPREALSDDTGPGGGGPIPVKPMLVATNDAAAAAGTPVAGRRPA